MDKGKKKVPPCLHLTSMLTASITAVLSITYLVLSILGLIYRYNCDVTSQATARGSDHFMNMILGVYIQSDITCPDSPNWDGLTAPDSVFVLNIITLCASVLTLIAAVVLILMVQNEDNLRYLHITAYIYVGVWFASFAVDLTYATHFGMDFTTMTNQMDLSSAGLPLNYDRDLVRLGALLLLAITLKGFVAHAIQLVLIILLLVYAVDFQQQVQKEEHSIHKLGALNAYETHTNPAFVDSLPPRSPRRVLDYPRADYTRSESWQPSVLRDRPFSYLEEPKKPAVPPRPSSPAEQQWRRNEPPTPAPDYSPHSPRRLKSALKPSYM